MKTKVAAPDAPRVRPSLAVVAKLAGVSLMTVSYAMRNNPKISRPTRERVQRAAKKVGYVPHPEIGRLMHLLRSQRLPSYQATLGFLSFSHDTPAAPHPYTVGVIAGARSRAAALGYAVDLLNIDTTKLSQMRLTTMLKSRGIRGVLLPPLPAIADCSQLVDWRQFSVVAATYSAQNLIVNRVVPHHQNNIMLAISQLQRQGHRRLGLVLTADLARRANFAYEAAFALHQQMGDMAQIPTLGLNPLAPALSASAIKPWLRQYHPGYILTVENAVPILRELLGRAFGTTIGICLLDHSGFDPFPGIHQLQGIIGETAVDILAGQVQRGELGFELHPRVTMVEGHWLDRAATPLRRLPLHPSI